MIEFLKLEGFLLFFITFYETTKVVEAINCKGCTPLDTYSFEKIVPKFRATLIKFDVAYPYGAKHDEYGKVSELTRGVPDLLIAEINIKDYGDKDNTDLAEKFHVKSSDFPVIKLIRKGIKEALTYDGEWKADDITQFIRSTTGVYIGLPGCIQQFDAIASDYIKTKDPEKRKELLDEAKAILQEGMDTPKNTEYAQIYIKLMEKIDEKGENFVAGEISRVESLRKTKVSIDKKEGLQKRLNILQSFVHEEL